MLWVPIALLISISAPGGFAATAPADMPWWIASKCYTGSASDLDAEETGAYVSMEACHAVCLARKSCAGATFQLSATVANWSNCQLFTPGGGLNGCASTNYGYAKEWTAVPDTEATFTDADLDIGELGGNIKFSIENYRGDFQTHFLIYIAEWDTTSTGKMWGAPRTGLNKKQLCLVAKTSSDPPYPSWVVNSTLSSPGLGEKAPRNCAMPADEDGNFTYTAHIAPEVVHDKWTHFLVYPVVMGKFWTDPIHVEATDLTVTMGYLSFTDTSTECGMIGGQLEFSSLAAASLDVYDLYLSNHGHLNQGTQVLLRSALQSEAPPIAFEPTSINGSEFGVPGDGLFTHLLIAARSKSAQQTKNYASIRINDLGMAPKVVNVMMADSDQFVNKVGGCVQWDIVYVHAMCVQEHIVIFQNTAGATVIELPPVPAGATSAPLPLQTSWQAKVVVQSSLTHYGRDVSTWPVKVQELAAPLFTEPESTNDILGEWPSSKFLDVSLSWNWTTKARIAYNFAPLESTSVTEVAFSKAWNSDPSLAATALKDVFGELCLGGVEILMRTTIMKYYPDMVRDGCGVAKALIRPPMCWTHRHGLLPGENDFIIECTVKMDIPAPHLCRQCSMLWKGIRNGSKASVYVLERNMCGSYRAVPW